MTVLELVSAAATKGRPARSRSLAFVRRGERGGVFWVVVLEAWDSPPSWFDVPEVDLQPKLAEVVFTAFEGVLARPLDAGAEVLLGEALDAAGEALRERAKDAPAVLHDGSGAFVAAVLSRGDQLAIAWAGGARVYRLRGGELAQLSKDHVLGREMGAPGALQHVVTRQLASGDGAEVVGVEPRDGDRLVLVSADAAELLATHRAQAAAGSPEAAVAALLAAWPGALASAGVAVVDVRVR